MTTSLLQSSHIRYPLKNGTEVRRMMQKAQSLLPSFRSSDDRIDNYSAFDADEIIWCWGDGDCGPLWMAIRAAVLFRRQDDE